MTESSDFRPDNMVQTSPGSPATPRTWSDLFILESLRVQQTVYAKRLQKEAGPSWKTLLLVNSQSVTIHASPFKTGQAQTGKTNTSN